jgi:hypothetical protein
MAAHFEHPLGNVRVWMVFGVSDACLRGFDNLGRYFGQFEQNGFDGANAPSSSSLLIGILACPGIVQALIWVRQSE